MTPPIAHQQNLAIEEPLGDYLVTTDLLVEQVISDRLLECSPDFPLREAARCMSEMHCSSILVVDGDRLLGIWTQRDTLALNFDDANACSQAIGQVMNSPPQTVLAGTALQQVATRFHEERIHHLVVVDEVGRRVGVVSRSDMLLNQSIEHYMRLRSVGAVFNPTMVVIAESEPLSAVARQMLNAGMDALVVRFDGGDFGIITERDMLHSVAAPWPGRLAGEIASRPLIGISSNASLSQARSLMSARRVRHLAVRSEDGELQGVLGFSDLVEGIELSYVNELRQALREHNTALRVSRRSLQLAEKIIEHSGEGVMITDCNGRIVSVNPAFTSLTGYRLQEVIGRTPAVLKSGRHGPGFYERMWAEITRRGQWHGEIWNRRKTGEVFPESLSITAITNDDGEITHYAGLFSDISALKENEERAKYLAYFDPLTGLPNRRLFMDRLGVAMAHVRRNHGCLAVLCLDLDRFKRINDSLGHSAGDRLLCEVGSRIKRCIREDDSVARMGGDEYVILLSEVANVDQAVYVATRIIAALKEPLHGEHEFVVTCSIGVALYPENGHSPDDLIRNADAAMYRAKDSGRDNYQLYTSAINARSLEQLALEVSLSKALSRDELVIHYQPIVAMETGDTLELEALLRWRHPAMGLIGPASFIPLAEDSGFIVQLGEWVLRNVCRQLRLWKEEGRHMRVAVNISPRQFRASDFLDRIGAITAEEGIEPSALNLELTEGLLMDEGMDVVRMLDRIREMGMGISIDDFGVGYSSLSYLRRFPVTSLKIDRSFIRDMESSEENAAIVSAIIELAHSLRLRVIAEGVECEEQRSLLAHRRCDAAQGFYFSRPVAAAEI